ncbi:MAG: ABC transporter ATP-binding protein [Thermaerobacter sp.]|nr:ABC transporter ATP-binding protein [Thermaerobacter sp.]
MLMADGLVKRFQSRTNVITAVDGIAIAVAAGEVLAFLGPNGAGKTTTIKMVAGLVRPDQGRVTISNIDVTGRPALAAAHLGAVLEGSRNLYWRLTCLENLIYWGTLRRLTPRAARTRAVELLRLVGLEDRQHNTVQTLSRGMQQKLALCQALMHRPKLLLLDEPTLGLDFASSETIKTTVRDLARDGVAILLTTHQMDVAQQLSDRLAIIRSGKLVLSGTTTAILTQYSKPMWRITTASPLPTDRIAAVRALGWQVEQPSAEAILVTPREDDADGIYQLLDVLRPEPIRLVERHRADLAEVFQQVVEEGANAQ